MTDSEAGQSAWNAFIEGGGALSRELASVLEAGDDAPIGRVLEVLTAVEMDARVVGVREIADLAEALRQRIVSLEGRPPDADDRQALRGGVAALGEAFSDLTRPDASGAHLDAQRMTDAIEALRSGAGVPPPPRTALTPPKAPTSTDDDTRWEPQVDEDMIDPFLEECQERLASLSERLVELERNPDDTELVRAIFRDLHTLKGSSGFVGLKRMNRLAHAAEDLVGQVREGRRAADRPAVDALLSSLDALSAIVARATARESIDIDIDPVIAQLRGAPPQRVSRAPAEAGPPPALRATAAQQQKTLRIEFEKLDLLMNLVGELVIAKGRLAAGVSGLSALARELDEQRRNARQNRDSNGRGQDGRGPNGRGRIGAVRAEDLSTEIGRVQRAFDQLGSELEASRQQLDFAAGQLRDQVMKLRMVPIGRAWSKYHRVVREIARKLDKPVRLELVGAETELDKVLVELLDDPFLHLVRNAIDHGIEPPETRKAADKPPEGLLRLSASHRGNQIVVRIEDDGAGIDPDRVRRKAIEQGLVDEATADELSDEQVFDLIFRPGFSTAQAVSEMSGRGVGMDVVKDAISKLKGTIRVESVRGEGTRFELRLPLTLAIVQVLLVRCAGQVYAIPIDLVKRTVVADPELIRSAAGYPVLLANGVDIPLIRLHEALSVASVPRDGEPESVVLVDVGGELYGLSCDGFVGRQEIVIKSLGNVLARVLGAAGATLVGDKCVVILDVPALIAYAVSTARAPQERSLSAPTVGVSGDAQRVLIAEDSDVIRESMRRALLAAGYKVTAARDGAEALAAAAEERFDLVSTDVVMPNVDGYELTRRLRQTPEYRDVPILMVTSKGERVDRIRGFDAGVDAYLTKPADAAELLRVVRTHLPPPSTPTRSSAPPDDDDSK